MKKRLHILGASGSGTSTLGAGLAREFGIKHLDADDFFWKKTAIPFSQKEPVEERIHKLQQELNSVDEWVLSGSICGWGDSLIQQFTHAFFLWAPWEIRRDRLHRREVERFGFAALQPEGVMHEIHSAFMAWAELYDVAGFEQRSRATHEEWMRRLPESAKVVRLNGTLCQSELLGKARDSVLMGK